MAKWNLLYAVALNDYYGKKARARLKKIEKKWVLLRRSRIMV